MTDYKVSGIVATSNKKTGGKMDKKTMKKSRMSRYLKPTKKDSKPKIKSGGTMKCNCGGGKVKKAQAGAVLAQPAATALTKPPLSPLYQPTVKAVKVQPKKPITQMTAATDPRNSQRATDIYKGTNLSVGGGPEPTRYDTSKVGGNYTFKAGNSVNGVPSYEVGSPTGTVRGKSYLRNLSQRIFKYNPNIKTGVVLNGQKFKYSKY